MKKLALVLALALLTAAPSSAAGLGVGMAYWDTSDAGSDEGIGIRAAFDAGDAVSFELRASFFDGFGQVANNALTRLEATPVDLGLAYHFNRGAKVQPYLGGGGTFVFTNAIYDGGQVPVSGGPEVNDEFGFYLVAGLDIEATERFGVYGEVFSRHVKLNVTGNGLGFQDFQSDFSGPAATVGVMLHW